MEEGRSTFKILTGKQTYGKETIRKARGRWEDNIRMDLKQVGINTRNWVYSALVNAALNLRVPYAMELVS